ncbi:MAG: hypothetical protein H0W99_04250 [Acidobacteria bacterium]|nr:hypothetical protein [Acidobacteriota bacterium]
MIYRILRPRFMASLALLILFCSPLLQVRAQSQDAPITSQEMVRMVQQLPAHPEKRDELVKEIRRRGIGFELTGGLRSVVASKSGNDALLRRTLEEAARRRVNPVASALPPEAEARDLLSRTRVVTLAASEAMPDFIVKQLITRSFARGETNNWVVSDRLTVAVSFRANIGEEYKVIAVNGLPPSAEVKEGQSYEQVGGTSSTGEYVSMLAALFKEDTQAKFQAVDTDLLRGRRTIIYEFEVKKQNSHQSIKAGAANTVITGYRGRIWIDRELDRVLRVENISTEIPAFFPVTAAASLIDYDWVTIAERRYLLPSRAEVILTSRYNDQSIQSRNEIRFRGYQKFGTEVRIIEDVDDAEETQDEPKPESKKP